MWYNKYISKREVRYIKMVKGQIEYKGTIYSSLKHCFVALGIVRNTETINKYHSETDINAVIDFGIRYTLEKCQKEFPDFEAEYKGVVYQDIQSYAIMRHAQVEDVLYRLKRNLSLEPAFNVSAKDLVNIQYKGRVHKNLNRLFAFYGINCHVGDVVANSIARAGLSVQQACDEVLEKAYAGTLGFDVSNNGNYLASSLDAVVEKRICLNWGTPYNDVVAYQKQYGTAFMDAVQDVSARQQSFFYKNTYYNNLSECCKELGLDEYKVLSTRRLCGITTKEALDKSQSSIIKSNMVYTNVLELTK